MWGSKGSYRLPPPAGSVVILSKFLAACLKRARNAVRRAGALTRPPEPIVEVFGHEGQAMSRECMVCRKRFNSSWTGQRICNECKAGENTKPA